MATKSYFVFDSETGYLLSGVYRCEDSNADGLSIFTRPFKDLAMHRKGELCEMYSLYNYNLEGGLKSLKRENMHVGSSDAYMLDADFEANPEYFTGYRQIRGWWKLLDLNRYDIVC